MAEKLTHEEFNRQVEEAMQSPTAQGGQGFSLGIQKMRQTASKRKPLQQGRQITVAR